MSNRISSLSITIDGTTYHYEAHTHQRVAEILHGQIETLNALNKQYNTNKTIDSFTIHHFQ